MLHSLSQRLSRKRMNSRTHGSYSDLVNLRKVPSTTEGLAFKSTGCISPETDATPQEASYSVAGFHAKDPQHDQHILQADSKHIFAAVLTQSSTVRGGHYLRQHLYMEFLDQIQRHKQNLAAALQAAIQSLNKDFVNLHPFNQNLLDGVSIAVAYVDFASLKLHVASNGSCRCIVGRSHKSGEGVEVVADVGGSIPEESTGVSQPTELATIQLSQRIDTVIIGSSGFWQEVPPQKALLRVQCWHEISPKANGSVVAAHLINYAMHRITQRVKNHKDPRMASLKSVNNLLSLQTGDKYAYKFGSRQPVRRRRGDVHDDLTAAVFHLDWEGGQRSLKKTTKKPPQAFLEKAATAQTSHKSHWDLVRMHFLEFPRRASAQNRQQWADVVSAALQANRREGKSAARETSNAIKVLANSSQRNLNSDVL